MTKSPKSPPRVTIILNDSSDDDIVIQNPVRVSKPNVAAENPPPRPTRVDPQSQVDSITHALESLELRQPNQYAIGGQGSGQISEHWSEASGHQNRGSHVVNLSPRKKRRHKAHAYVVFMGPSPGVYTDWLLCAGQISRGGCLYLAYLSERAATAAFQFASNQGWVQASPPPPAIYTTSTLAKDTPFTSVFEHVDDNPVNTAVCRPTFYVVTSGIHPGIFRSYPEAGLAWVGVPKASQSSYPTLEEARLEFRLALAEGRVIRHVVI
ncbi:hypothetical protein BDZ89DRAFT_1142890 [Hymenopellis radicata]|nr:hypothetical protein BDZ89DRAFT_1142890 [Hymenopellis radicata]